MQSRMRNRVGGWVAALSVGALACGGTAIIDPPGGAGGAATTGSGTTSATSATATVSTGASMMSCEAINEAYEKAFEQAQSCDLNASSNPCTSQQDPTLVCPCAAFFINPQSDSFGELEKLRKAYADQGCGEGVPCPDIACSQPNAGKCVPASGGGGVCQNT